MTNRAFAKTGSGQNICEKSFWKTKARFLAGANLTWANESCPVEVRKTPLFAMPFMYQMHLFTTTGSGQTWGKHSKKSGVLC